MRPLSIVALVLPLLAGCGAPQGLEPLELSPPEAERGLWEQDASAYQRYDGHAQGLVEVHEPDGSSREWTIEGDTQPAGVYETRARLLGRDDGVTVDVIAVAAMAEPAYYQAVTAEVTSADAVLVAVRARELEGDADGPAAAAQSRLARATVEALRHRVVFVGDALKADARWTFPVVDPKVLEARRAAQPDEEELAEAVEGVAELVEEHGVELVVHVVAVSRVRSRTGVAVARRGPTLEGAFDPEARHGSEGWDDFGFEARTLRDACLKGLEPHLAGPGPRRVALLVPPVTARAVTGALLKQGFAAREERWLPAVRLAR